MIPIDELLRGLQGVKKGAGGWTARCPAHEDHRASLSIGEGTDGRILLHCHAGCDLQGILDALEVEVGELFPEDPRGKGEILTTYDYTDAEGKLLFQVVRFYPKDFRQRRPAANGEWEWSLGDTPRVLYHLPEVRKAVAARRRVFLTEGEKDVHTLEAWGFVATCNPGGAGKWPKECSEGLRGAHVVILPDNDDAGRRHAELVAGALEGVAADVVTVTLPGLTPKGDVTDWARLGGTAEKLKELVTQPAVTPVDDLASGDCEEEHADKAEHVESGEKVAFSEGRDFRTTDLGNAERLKAHYGDQLRYEPLSGRWYHWQGTHWEPDATLAVDQCAALVARSIYEEAADTKDDHRRKELAKHAVASESRGRQQAMIDSARHLMAVKTDYWDRNPMLFNVVNGTIDLETGRLRKHRSSDGITKVSPVIYDPHATCPTFDRFFATMVPDADVRDFLLRSAGYALTGLVVEQHFWFLFGCGANGKSTLTNIIEYILADYARTAAPHLLERSRERHPAELADLLGARIVIAHETQEGRALDETRVKQLTGGDRVKARFMRGDFFEFEPTHKIWIHGNHRPRISGIDHAIWRRPLLVNFPVIIQEEDKDPQLLDKLKTEASGILTQLVLGCLQWQREGGLHPPASVQAATDAYRLEEDAIGRFIAERCVLAPEASEQPAALYDDYKYWCEQVAEEPVTNTAFGRSLTERGYVIQGGAPQDPPRYPAGRSEKRRGDRVVGKPARLCFRWPETRAPHFGALCRPFSSRPRHCARVARVVPYNHANTYLHSVYMEMGVQPARGARVKRINACITRRMMGARVMRSTRARAFNGSPCRSGWSDRRMSGDAELAEVVAALKFAPSANADKRCAVAIALRDYGKFSDKTVASMRYVFSPGSEFPSLSARTGRSGKEYRARREVKPGTAKTSKVRLPEGERVKAGLARVRKG